MPATRARRAKARPGNPTPAVADKSDRATDGNEDDEQDAEDGGCSRTRQRRGRGLSRIGLDQDRQGEGALAGGLDHHSVLSPPRYRQADRRSDVRSVRPRLDTGQQDARIFDEYLDGDTGGNTSCKSLDGYRLVCTKNRPTAVCPQCITNLEAFRGEKRCRRRRLCK
jgi:hypothetical protein